MSSTTSRSKAQGQILVLFAGGLAALFIIAALAFDAGMLFLERRDQQNAADAGALAGARYVLASANFAGHCAAAGTNAAVVAACQVMVTNGFNDADPNQDVFVYIPPTDGAFRNFPGMVQVKVSSTRASIFGGIIGRGTWPVGAASVAANQPGVVYAFGMLGLSPTACKAIDIGGTGVVNSASNIQSNSDGSGCGGGSRIGFARNGGGVLNVTAPDAVCRSVGTIQDTGSGSMNCAKGPNSFALPDPLASLPAPTKPALAAAMKEVTGSPPAVITPAQSTMPDYCPGKTGARAPVEATPQLCTLGNGAGQSNRKWILSPGLYPGGINLKGGVTVYLLPGIYWIGGGGFQAANDVSVISVTSETDRTPAVCVTGATPPCTGGGGILIYNSKLVNSAAGPISLGGGGAVLNLQPYDYPFGASTIDLVMFQDRTVSSAITLNGSDSQASSVRGIVYAPLGDMTVNGAASVFTMDQVIANTFKITGSGGTINILRELGIDAKISAVGLVE